MYKIFLSVRNRIAITTKCITAINRFSEIPHQIYVFDNSTSYQVKEHFMYFSILYEKGIISQYTVNTKDSTFNAFSKAVACNQFGYNHEQDPDKDKYDFLLFLDNDIIVTPGFDKVLKKSWDDVKKLNMKNIKVIGQLPGGIKEKKDVGTQIGGYRAKSGIFGGSGLWAVRTNFFKEVGYLNVKELVGQHKRHDQLYWKKLGDSTNGKDYILGLDYKLGIHCGKMCGSICNTLTRNKNIESKKQLELIKFEEAEKKINNLSFDDFYKKIKDDQSMLNDW